MNNNFYPLMLLLASAPLQAMSWQERSTDIASVGAGNSDNQQTIARVSEKVQILVTYTNAVQTSNLPAELFCPPPGTPMDLDEIVSIVRMEAKSVSADSATPLQALLLEGFRNRFPCS